MTNQLVTFSDEQWGFLAVFAAIEEPISLDTVQLLSPLSPSSLLDVLERGVESKIIQKIKTSLYRISSGLPEAVRRKTDGINTPDRLTELLKTLKETGCLEQLSRVSQLSLLIESGKTETAGCLEIELADEAINKRHYEKAFAMLEKGLGRLSSCLENRDNSVLFVSATLKYSNIQFALGKDVKGAFDCLEKAGSTSDRIGDRRSRAFVDFHLGRLYCFSFRRREALEKLARGIEIIEELDDEFENTAAEFLALYYYLQGRFNTAIVYFEKGYKALETQGNTQISNPVAPIFLGACGMHLGQFNTAIGSLDSAWRHAKKIANHRLATTIRSLLGTPLLAIGKKKEAMFHFQSALKDAEADDNMMAEFLAVHGIVHFHYTEGRMKEAYDLLKGYVEKGYGFLQGTDASFEGTVVHPVTFPWLLDLLADFDRLGYPAIPQMNLKQQLKELLDDPSVQLRGIAYNHKARLLSEEGADAEEIRRMFSESERLLKLSGDPIHTAKTRIEIARFELSAGNRTKASIMARKARKGLSGFFEDVFPDGIRGLLEEEDVRTIGKPSNDYFERFFQMTDEQDVPTKWENVFDLVLSSMNRFFRAERGGLFWTESENGKTLILRAMYNFNAHEVVSTAFRSNMKIVLQSFKENRPIVVNANTNSNELDSGTVKALLCIPLKRDGKTRGVLYHDNSYLEDCFDFIDDDLLVQLTKHVNSYINRLSKIERLMKDEKETLRKEIKRLERPESTQIIAKSPAMLKVLIQADKIAFSDSTVLVQGETGSGKELLARRLHDKSQRHTKPFIIVDPTTIPETLLESELFGHEKGAFTGANHRKIGLVELAHQGTLFIDEVGEIKMSAQSKLLRVLQEKTFTRVGGSQPIASDFRLLAATNRNLSAEVERGNFREDLFYRINIIPISIPPLRDRPEDIILLANHFLEYYKKKYSHTGIRMTVEDEEKFLGYGWPGNVRELVNVIERAVLLSTDDQLELTIETKPAATLTRFFDDTPSLDEMQRRYIHHVLNLTKGKIGGPGGAAELLGIKRTSLYTRMKNLGIR